MEGEKKEEKGKEILTIIKEDRYEVFDKVERKIARKQKVRTTGRLRR